MYWYNLHRHKFRQRGNAISWQRVINAWGCPENGAKGWACEKEFAPSFHFNEAHLWKREKFSLLSRLQIVFFFFIYCQAESCSSAFKALSVYSRKRTWLLFYYSTTIIPPLHFSFSCNIFRLCVAIVACYARG